MYIRAQVYNNQDEHQVKLSTNGSIRSITIPPKTAGLGSSVNGGELLLLALATCYCNDIYREAAKRMIVVKSVEDLVKAEFGAEGEPAKKVTYNAEVDAEASKEIIDELLRYTDSVAEIHNTLRVVTPVVFDHTFDIKQ